MFGGVHPPLDNAKMLGYQAYYFYATGRPDLAKSLAESAIKYSKKIPETLARKGAEENQRDSLLSNLEAFIRELGTSSKSSQLKSTWGAIHARFFVHLGAIVAVVGVIAIAISILPE